MFSSLRLGLAPQIQRAPCSLIQINERSASWTCKSLLPRVSVQGTKTRCPPNRTWWMRKLDCFGFTRPVTNTPGPPPKPTSISLSSPNYDGHPAGNPRPNLNQHPWGSSVTGSARYVLPPVRWHWPLEHHLTHLLFSRVNRTTMNRSLPPSNWTSRSVRRVFRKSDSGNAGRPSKSRFTHSHFGSFTSVCGTPRSCQSSTDTDQTPRSRSL